MQTECARPYHRNIQNSTVACTKNDKSTYTSASFEEYFDDEYLDNIDWYGRYSSAVFVDAFVCDCDVSVDEFESKPVLILPDSFLKFDWQNVRCVTL